MNQHLSIDWAPLLDWPILAGLAAAAVIVLALAAWRRAQGTAWRGLALALLLAALANPSLVQEQREGLDDVALIVLDESPSQGIGTREAESAQALDELQATLATLPNTDVQVVRGGDITFGSEDRGTRLFDALRDGLANVPRQRIGAVFMISDGQVHDTPDSLEQLGLDVPLHLLLSGRKNERDRRVVITQAPSFGIVGRPLSLKLRVDDLPDSLGGQAQVEMRQDGGDPQIITVPIGQEIEVPFELSRRGPSIIELSVGPGPEELTLLNNHTAAVINGVRERLRVLLVSGEPHAGERAWRNILKSDPSVDLVHFTILRPPEKQDGTPIRELSLIAFPTRELFEIKLDEFDLIIFDRYRRRGVLPSIYLDNIARYVAEGGALLEAVGPTFATPLSLYRTPLGRVLPAEPSGDIFEEGYRPTLTAVGERHPVTADLPGAHDGPNGEPSWGRWFRHVDADPSSGVITMAGIGDRPLLILDRVGEGRVAQLMSDQMWLWARGYEGGGPQAELLRRISHWLMQEPDLEEEDLRAQVTGGHLDIERRSLSTELPEVEVTLPSGDTQTLSLEPGDGGRSHASMPASEAGLYRITDGERRALAVAGPISPLEFKDLRSTAEILAPLIEASDGGVHRIAEGALPRLRKVVPGRDRHGNGWLGVQNNDSFVVTGVSQMPLIPAVVVLLLVLGSMTLAWWREGR